MNLISNASSFLGELLKKTKIFSKKIISLIPFVAVGSVAVTSVPTDVQAADVGNGVTDDDNTATAYVFNTATKDLTITSEAGASPAVYTVQTGAITDNATRGDIVIQSTTDDTATLNVTIASVTLDAGNTVGIITIQDVDAAQGDMNVTFSGAVTTDTTTIIKILEDVDAETLTVNFDGATTLTGAVEAENDASNATGALELKASAAITFSAGLDLS